MQLMELYVTIKDLENTMLSAGTRNMAESWPASSGSEDVAYENVKLAEAVVSSARVRVRLVLDSKAAAAPTLMDPSV
jgi:hypothetical protein